MYINEVWVDPALNFEHLSPCKHNLSMSHQVLEKLWTPNSCFINSKVAEIHNSPFRLVPKLAGGVWQLPREWADGIMDVRSLPPPLITFRVVWNGGECRETFGRVR